MATKKGPRQRVICSMGDLSPRPEAEWLKLVHKVESSLVGQVPLAQQDAEVAAIVAKVRAREARLFNLDRTIVFYDVTSTYFEGEAKGIRKAKRGYSRDGRPDAKQVLVGMGINGDGFPVAHEIFEGNLLDTQTLVRMLEAMDRRIGLKAGQTVVVDRGMAFEENLE